MALFLLSLLFLVEIDHFIAMALYLVEIDQIIALALYLLYLVEINHPVFTAWSNLTSP
jgi:hypothetical protein